LGKEMLFDEVKEETVLDEDDVLDKPKIKVKVKYEDL